MSTEKVSTPNEASKLCRLDSYIKAYKEFQAQKIADEFLYLDSKSRLESLSTVLSPAEYKEEYIRAQCLEIRLKRTLENIRRFGTEIKNFERTLQNKEALIFVDSFILEKDRKEISKKYNCSEQTISNIKARIKAMFE